MSIPVEPKIRWLSRDRNASDAAAGRLSIVVPLYNEASTLERLHTRLIEVARRLAATRSLACEVIYIDDGSRDGTLAIARKLPATALVAGDFRLLSPRAAIALRQLPERNRFFKGLSSWIGFRQMRIDYEPEPRAEGRSTWNLRRMIGLSIERVTDFTVAPLRLATLIGTVLALVAFFYGLQIVYETFVHGTRVPGYPSPFVGVMVLGGVQLIMIGVLGEYIGKILSRDQRPSGLFRAKHEVKTNEAAKRPPRVTRSNEARTVDLGLIDIDDNHRVVGYRAKVHSIATMSVWVSTFTSREY